MNTRKDLDRIQSCDFLLCLKDLTSCRFSCPPPYLNLSLFVLGIATDFMNQNKWNHHVSDLIGSDHISEQCIEYWIVNHMVQ